MNTKAGLGEYVLQTRNTFFDDSMGVCTHDPSLGTPVNLNMSVCM